MWFCLNVNCTKILFGNVHSKKPICYLIFWQLLEIYNPVFYKNKVRKFVKRIISFHMTFKKHFKVLKPLSIHPCNRNKNKKCYSPQVCVGEAPSLFSLPHALSALAWIWEVPFLALQPRCCILEGEKSVNPNIYFTICLPFDQLMVFMLKKVLCPHSQGLWEAIKSDKNCWKWRKCTWSM